MMLFSWDGGGNLRLPPPFLLALNKSRMGVSKMAKKYVLTGKASIRGAFGKLEKGGEITAAQYKKLPALFQGFFEPVAKEETPAPTTAPAQQERDEDGLRKNQNRQAKRKDQEQEQEPDINEEVR